MTEYSPTAFANYTAAPRRKRHDGWTAERQRCFLETLAETGCVKLSAAAAGMSARSAYRFRLKPEAEKFLNGWNTALELASARLVAIAFDRAINGVVEETIKDGEVVGQKRRYSDKLLMFLITHTDAARYGNLSAPMLGDNPFAGFDPVAIARKQLPSLLAEVAAEERDANAGKGDVDAENDASAI